MHRSVSRLVVAASLSLVALLAVSAATAGAHGGPGRSGVGKGARAGALVTEAAKQLGVTRAALVAAIEKAAVARIDEAVADETSTPTRRTSSRKRRRTTCDAEEAAEFKAALEDEDLPGYKAGGFRGFRLCLGDGGRGGRR
jgi:hypothetical protein